MLSSANLISCCNDTSLLLLHRPNTFTLRQAQPKNPNPAPTLSKCLYNISNNTIPLHRPSYLSPPSSVAPTELRLKLNMKRRWGALQICHDSLNNNSNNNNTDTTATTKKNETGKRDWTTSFLLFLLWGALLYYAFVLSPNQTPSRDMYFLEKLLNLKGDDGFVMNEVLVSLWYIMGLWPLVYSMLLLPSGRSSNSIIPVWPFVTLSFFGGAFALLPYFVLWKPPPPPIEEAELRKWPLNFLESKLTAGALIAAGLGIITYAGLANADVWKEFYQYFRESKFIHVTSIDFTLLSTFAPFWVYNDMTARKWSDKGSWILPLTVIPFLGPALYLVLRPPLLASLTINKEDTD